MTLPRFLAPAAALALLVGCTATRVEPVVVPPESQAFVDLHFFHGARGMVIPPEGMRGYEVARDTPFWPMVAKRVNLREGLLPTTDNTLIGVLPVEHKGVKAGTMGCASCHSGKAAGVFVPGLGNKNFDVLKGGSDYGLLTRYLHLRPRNKGEAERELITGAKRYAEVISDRKRGNATQGLVPTGMVFGWFYDAVGVEVPDSLTAGAVKTPHMWGYAAKREAGFFCDGLGDGDALAWNVGVSLTAGQTHEAVEGYYDEIDAAQKLFEALESPDYPFEIDEDLVHRGAAVFSRKCSGCHGTYEGREVPPVWIPIEKVGTDSERVDIKTPELAAAAARNPLGRKIAIKYAGRGYFAPRLEGIWSRFPYLHNASVPNISALLTPPSERPRVFSLEAAGERERFDEEALGLTLEVPGSLAERRLKARATRGSRRVFDAERLGHSPQGHPFGTDLPAVEKRALIEYLKTL